ncbi:hypothetical protein NQ318_002957 [Aromia moschata]|uniref:Uncharacterized protein n=1 Tax=Aromia moschata TaxID=1265417 RepID=A0AAV8YRI0_9CUCU|nr:hypothetical protein NQ318_002957 [Aromia moschata]
MKRVAATFNARALTDNQKEYRVETCRALKQQLETDPDFLSKDITDELVAKRGDLVQHKSSYDTLFRLQDNLSNITVRSGSDDVTLDTKIDYMSTKIVPSPNCELWAVVEIPRLIEEYQKALKDVADLTKTSMGPWHSPWKQTY